GEITERDLRGATGDGLLHMSVPVGVVHPAHPEQLLHRVPVVPPEDRPLHEVPGGARRPDAVARAYLRLMARSRRAVRLLELDAPAIIQDHERRMLQEAFDVVLAALDGRGSDEGSAIDAIEFEPPPDPAEWESMAVDQPRWSCAFLGGDAVLVADGTTATRL